MYEKILNIKFLQYGLLGQVHLIPQFLLDSYWFLKSLKLWTFCDSKTAVLSNLISRDVNMGDVTTQKVLDFL